MARVGEGAGTRGQRLGGDVHHRPRLRRGGEPALDDRGRRAGARLDVRRRPRPGDARRGGGGVERPRRAGGRPAGLRAVARRRRRGGVAGRPGRRPGLRRAAGPRGQPAGDVGSGGDVELHAGGDRRAGLGGARRRGLPRAAGGLRGGRGEHHAGARVRGAGGAAGAAVPARAAAGVRRDRRPSRGRVRVSTRGYTTPNSRPTATNAATAWSTCAGVCAAESCTRMRACPRGTTGKEKPIT